ncbi:hypothetical protein [Aquibium sp. ELW1220]|uniref:YunG family protein n=1 Tax=Aquibium sp. ELW1220 TaxID=2976766 RepID=UPI0025B0DB01|nr:hypothetical protein [Aquibium sp. ELW1220]MDN2582843.1 hypothetical protein [Aquibium sp. ELW1220]
MRSYRDLPALRDALETAWSAETSTRWTKDVPALGQCSVTALVVNDVFGGDILKTRTPQGVHFYNRVGARRFDLTASQFDEPVSYDDLPASRAEAMADTSPAQYQALRSRL